MLRPFTCALALLAAVAIARPAAACPQYDGNFDEAAFVEARAAYEAAPDGLMKALHYIRMLNVEEPLRRLVVDTGLDSGVEEVRAVALECEFLAANSMTIRTMDPVAAAEVLGAASELQAEVLREGVVIPVPVRKAFPETLCFSIHGGSVNECDDRYNASLNEGRISLFSLRNYSARFTREGGRYAGTLTLLSYTPEGSRSAVQVTVPAILEIN
jgi:hypothetical protein